MIEPEIPSAGRHETLSLTTKISNTEKGIEEFSSQETTIDNELIISKSINKQQDRSKRESKQQQQKFNAPKQPQSETRPHRNVISFAIKITLGKIFINSIFKFESNNIKKKIKNINNNNNDNSNYENCKQNQRQDHLTYCELANSPSNCKPRPEYKSPCVRRFAYATIAALAIISIIRAIVAGSAEDFVQQALTKQTNPLALENSGYSINETWANKLQKLQLPTNTEGPTLHHDSRACITATYLCVLIVNNTWIDCKLLETLCNNRYKQRDSHAPSTETNSDERSRDQDDDVGVESSNLSLIDWDNFSEMSPKPVERRQREGRANWQARSLAPANQFEIPLQDESGNQQQQLIPISSSRRTKAIVNQDFELSQKPTASPLVIASSGDFDNNNNKEQEFNNKQQIKSKLGSDLTARIVSQHDDRSIGFSQYLNVLHGLQRGSSSKNNFAYDNKKDSIITRETQTMVTLTNNHAPVNNLARLPSADTPSPAPLVRLEFDDNFGNNLNNNNNIVNYNATAATTPTTSTTTSMSTTCCDNQDFDRPLTLMGNDVTTLINASPPATHENLPANTGILPSWMRVPFRWGSISIWPTSFGHTNLQQQPQHLGEELKSSSSADIDPVATLQILRPIDRGLIAANGDLQQQPQQAVSQFTRDLFDTKQQRPTEALIANQTTFNQHYASQQQQQQGNPFLNRQNQLSTSMSNSKQQNHNSIVQLSDQQRDFQQLPLQNFQSSKFLLVRPQQQQQQIAEFQNNQNSAFASMISQSQQQQPSLIINNQFGNIRTKNMIANEPQQQVAEQGLGCECDPMYPIGQNSVEMMQQQQFFNRQGTNRNGVMQSPPSLYSDCRVQCILQNQQQQQQEQQLTSQDSMNNNQNIPMTSSETSSSPITASIPSPSATTISSTMSTPSPTPTPSKVAPPLEVSFILYTRHHRDLAYKFAINQLTKSGSSASVAAATVTATPESITTVASQQLMLSGELIDLTNETTTPSGDDKLIQNTIGNVIINNQLALNSSQSIKMIIHGFGSGARRPWVADMVYKLLEYEDVIVIVVDWEKGATLPNYVQAAGNTRLVGHKIASFIKAANVKYGFTGHQYHLIGFSLGAHVAGFAGMECNSTQHLLPRIVIQRITGLDPASPLFEGYEANDRLDPTDAKFVDVIHSNGDGVLRGGFGSLQPMGHVDFYPNGGRVQVGCNSVLLSALSDIIYGKWQSLCNHRRALNFFMDSFEYAKCRFRSFKCDSYESYVRGECFDCGHNNEGCSYMGYRANQSRARGKMYLTTHEEAPFCANQFIIKLIGTKGYKTTWGKIEVTLVTFDGKNESFWLSPSLNRDRDLRSQQQSTSTLMNSQSAQSLQSSVSMASTSSSPSPLINMNNNMIINNSQQQSAAAASINSATPTLIGTSNGHPSSAPNNNNPNFDPSNSFNSIANNNNNNNSRDETKPSGSQMSLQSLIVTHPSLANFTQVLLRYTRYKGWIYSGDESWSIDKVFIMDSDGHVKSFCGPNTILESHITTRVNLEPGNCTVTETPCCPNGVNNQAGGVQGHRGAGPMSSSPSPAMLGMQSDEPQLDTQMLVNLAGSTRHNSVRPNALASSNGAAHSGSSSSRVARLYVPILHNNNNNENQNSNSLDLLSNFNPTLQPLQFVGGTSVHAFQRFAPLMRDRVSTQSGSTRPAAAAAATTTTTTANSPLSPHRHNYLAQQLVAQQQFAQQLIQPNNNIQNQQHFHQKNNNPFLAF